MVLEAVLGVNSTVGVTVWSDMKPAGQRQAKFINLGVFSTLIDSSSVNTTRIRLLWFKTLTVHEENIAGGYKQKKKKKKTVAVGV